MKRVETTPSRTGYPQSLRDAIIGFDNWDQIQQIAEALNIEPETFHKKEGWQLWTRNYGREIEPFDQYRRYTGKDNYITFRDEDFQDSSIFFNEEVLPRLMGDSSLTMEEAVIIIDNWKKIWDAIEELDEDKFVLVDQYDDFQVLDIKAVSYTDDTDMYAIGFVSSDKELLDKIENFEFKQKQ